MVRELQPDAHFTGVMIRDEHKEALRAIMEWFLNGTIVVGDSMDVDDIPLWNPFLAIDPGFISPSGRSFYSVTLALVCNPAFL